MSRLRAVLGSAAFVLFGGPTIVAGVVPWVLTRWEADDAPVALRALGLVLIALSGALVLETTARFALQGRGTPVPFAPPERFVARGSYRFVRNPMYVGVLALIVGQALLLGREILLGWAAVAAVLFQLFVVLHEEPELRKRFGSEYDDYRRRTGRWLPRLSRSTSPARR
jgi:protein-S-isoprenylcysteine O-methyltransferase Ste14